MALPTLSKTFQFSVNLAAGGLGVDADNQDLLFKVKEALVGFVSGQWTVKCSSDGTTANTSDNWLAYTNLVFNTGSNPHAWIVLVNSATLAEICIDCNVAFTSSESCPIYFSPGGGYATTGLVTTARPTPPADEITLCSGVPYGGSSNAWNGKLHVMMSDDGECTRVVVCRVNNAPAFWMFDVAKNPIAGWTTPNFASLSGQSTNIDSPTYTRLNDISTYTHSYITTAFDLFLTSEGYATAMLGENIAQVDSQLGSYAMCPMGLASTTVGHVGRKGEVYDLWWGPTNLQTGDTFPSDGSYQFAQFGDIILPWNGTSPQVS